MATWTEDIVDGLRALGGTGTLSDIYSAVGPLRPTLPESWRDIIRRNIQDRSSDSAGYRGAQDLFFSVSGLGAGVWGLRSLAISTPDAIDKDAGSEAPGRTPQLIYRVLRDTELARQLKLLHRDQCQLCGLALRLSSARTYSEAHHVVPLGAPHHGPDTAENILVLCPNHHALCDYGAIALDVASLRQASGHRLAESSVEYHNTHIVGARF
ncbi:HNH endonuclease [Oerskovia sp. USHLN155]|uniref:HNH endonuclease n=1 Tax=Oerskovia sp. USHLN155 TaxID=3081288 RepID=UPI0030198A07